MAQRTIQQGSFGVRSGYLLERDKERAQTLPAAVDEKRTLNIFVNWKATSKIPNSTINFFSVNNPKGFGL